MMSWVRLVLIWTNLLTSIKYVVWAADCTNQGLLVDIHNRAVGGREDTFRYGLSFGLGSPAQPDSLWPAIVYNETAFSSPAYCMKGSSQSCFDNARGFFSIQDSTTWRNDSSAQTLDSPRKDINFSTIKGEDTLNIWTTTKYNGLETLVSLDQFPALVLSNFSSSASFDPPFGPGGVLGLGPNSTVLKRLVDRGLIAARTFGLYLGSRLGQAGDDWSGSLVLGGYDSGRFQDPVQFYNQVPTLTENAMSPFKITVQKVSLVTSGQTTELADAPFDAYISTDRSPVQFPPVVTSSFARAFGFGPMQNANSTLRLGNQFDGNLTITLSNDLTVTFDSAWIMDQFSSMSISPMPFSGNGNEPVIFGASFLLRAYLLVNYDANPPNFGLAQALPDVTQIQQKPYCQNDVPAATITAITQPTANHSDSKSKKALIGGLCGGLLGGIILIALIWFLCGRKRTATKRNPTVSNTDDDSYMHRPTFKGSLQYWKAKTWRSSGSDSSEKQVAYIYPDVETGLKKKPHVATYMFTSFDSDSDPPLVPLPKAPYDARRSASPPVRGTRPMDAEKQLMATRQKIETTPSSSMTPLQATKSVGSTASSPEPIASVAPRMKSPTPISTFNRHPQSTPLPQHRKQGSKSSIQPITTDLNYLSSPGTTKDHDDVAQKHISYDKSLPATPAVSTPVSPSPVLSRPMNSKKIAPRVPRIPSLVIDFLSRKSTESGPPETTRTIAASPGAHRASGEANPVETGTHSLWKNKREQSTVSDVASRSTTQAKSSSNFEQTPVQMTIPTVTSEITGSPRRPQLHSTSSGSPAAIATDVSHLRDVHQPVNRERRIAKQVKPETSLQDKSEGKDRPKNDSNATVTAPHKRSANSNSQIKPFPNLTSNMVSAPTRIKRKELVPTGSQNPHVSQRTENHHHHYNHNATTRSAAFPTTPLSTRAPSAISPCTSEIDLRRRYSGMSSASHGDQAVSPMSAADEHPPRTHTPPLPPMPRLSALAKGAGRP